VRMAGRGWLLGAYGQGDEAEESEGGRQERRVTKRDGQTGGHGGLSMKVSLLRGEGPAKATSSVKSFTKKDRHAPLNLSADRVLKENDRGAGLMGMGIS